MWQKIEIKAGSKTAEVWKTIQDSFEANFIARGGPKDAALYFSSDVPGSDVTLYVSLGAASIFAASDWGGQPCDKPVAAGLLVGHASAVLPTA